MGKVKEEETRNQDDESMHFKYTSWGEKGVARSKKETMVID